MNGIIKLIFVLYLLASIVIMISAGNMLSIAKGAIQEVSCFILFGTGFIGFILGFCADYLNGIHIECKKNSMNTEECKKNAETQLYEQQKTNRQLQEFLSRLQ